MKKLGKLRSIGKGSGKGSFDPGSEGRLPIVRVGIFKGRLPIVIARVGVYSGLNSSFSAWVE
jgi:hypothetical protein